MKATVDLKLDGMEFCCINGNLNIQKMQSGSELKSTTFLFRFQGFDGWLLFSVFCIILFLLPRLDATNMKSSIPLGASVEDARAAMENEVEEVFDKTEQMGSAILVDSEVGLEELSQCIQSGQERSTVERWMECINSLSPRTPMDVLPFPTQEISSTDEEKCKDLTNLQEKSENEMDQEASVDFLRFNATHELQRQEIKSEIEVGVESDHRNGLIIDNVKNGYPEPLPLEEVNYEVPKTKSSTTVCTEMTTEAGSGGLDVKKPEYADGGKLVMLLKGNMDTGKPLGPLDHHISSDTYVENIKVVMENDVEQVREEFFGKSKQTDRTILVDSEVDLEDLSLCIQAGQERSTVQRWMECINSLSPHIPTGVFQLPIEDVSSTDLEKFQDITNLQEPSMKEEDEEISSALDASVCLSRLQISSADSVHSKVTHEFQGHEIKSEIAVESDDLMGGNGSITDINNGNPKLLTVEEAEYDVPKKMNLTTVYPEMKVKAGSGGLNAKKLESADTSKLLKELDATNTESAIPLSPLDASVDDSSVAMENDAVEDFGKAKQVGGAILVDSDVGLEELSECIQAGQERTTVERWIECINSLSPHTPVDVLPLPTDETSCTEEERCEDFTNWQEQSKKKMDQEASGAVEGSVDFIHSKVDHAFHKLEIKSEIEECVESDHLKGSTGNVKNGSLELHPLEKVKYEVPKMKNSITAYPEMTTEAGLGRLDIEEPESAGSRKILKLLKGYDILDCLLRNAKVVTLVISAILFIPWGLSRMAYKNLKTILLILTEAKQKSVAKIIKVLGSREIETSSVSSNGQETGESIVDSSNDHLLGSLGCYIGMAVASVVPEVIAINQQNEKFISADELARLMGLAVNESLFQVLGTGSKQFADDFEESFRSTFNIKELVNHAIYDKIRSSCDSQGKWNSSLEGWIAGRAVDKSAEGICVHNREIKTSSSAELQRPNTRVKFQVQSDKRSHKQETSGSPTSCNHSRKVGGDDNLSHLQHEFGNQSNFSNSDLQFSIKFSEAARNCRQKISEANCQVAGNDGAVSEGAIVGNLQQKYFHDLKCEVNVPHGNNHTPHLKNDSGEIERNSLIVEDEGVQAEKYPNNFVENSSFVSTEKATATKERKGQNNDCNPSEEIQGNKEISWMQKNTQKVVLHAHAQCEEQSERQLRQFSSSTNESDALALLLDNKNLLNPQFPNTLNTSVREQQKSNRLKSLELMQKWRNLEAQEEQFHVSSQSKNLARQSLELSHSKALLKKNAFIEEKLNKSYVDLSRACADELVAGMFFMLLALAYGAWRHSHALLSEAIALCQVSAKDTQKSSWFHKPMDNISGHFRIAVCEVIVVSRMLTCGVFAVFVSLIIRHIPKSLHQGAILLTVLGGFCGWLGKFYVDTLGGSGFHWLVCWEVLCILHAFSSCFPLYLFGFLNGQFGSKFIPTWLPKFSFHATLVVVLPVMAGLIPFASFGDWAKHFSNILFDYAHPTQ